MTTDLKATPLQAVARADDAKTSDTFRFNDGAAYERYMGRWSQLAGETFLDWLAPPSGQHWLDVGCGNGAFTETLMARCVPAGVAGIDPSAQQLVYARERLPAVAEHFTQGDAMALPYGEGTFDIAVMPLVIFFVPDPARGVAEMARVVRPGGRVCAYAWDMLGGGFPYEALLSEVRALGFAVPTPPSPEASQLHTLQHLWEQGGMTEVQTRAIGVERTFAGLDDFWATARGAPSVGPILATMSDADLARLREAVERRLPAQVAGKLTCQARANAVTGRVAT